jgi:hypothetical protein
MESVREQCLRRSRDAWFKIIRTSGLLVRLPLVGCVHLRIIINGSVQVKVLLWADPRFKNITKFLVEYSKGNTVLYNVK